MKRLKLTTWISDILKNAAYQKKSQTEINIWTKVDKKDTIKLRISKQQFSMLRVLLFYGVKDDNQLLKMIEQTQAKCCGQQK